MSMAMVTHVREKSNTRSSARTLLLNLAIYANDCCGVAWPADATLRHETNVSHQRIHELKHVLKDAGELVIVERPGTTNLYFVAWHGQLLGGTSKDDSRHDPRCPLRHTHTPEREVALHTQTPPAKDPGGTAYERTGEEAEFPDPLPEAKGAEVSGEGSEKSKGRGQKNLTQKQEKTARENNVNVGCSRGEENDQTPNPEPLDPYAADVIEQCIQWFNDAHSRGWYRQAIRVVGAQVFYTLMLYTWEQRTRIHCLGAYLTVLLKAAAAQQGRALGRTMVTPSPEARPPAMSPGARPQAPDDPWLCERCRMRHATLACP